ncbi:hypothetical protein HPB47_019492 [Ixodes persulcatus]|uniref:Uncharacterized protein n=1 Tax=Ixodes persulcatus TaxID=34615 RepID=A0AC60QKA1_IXOPE|nr:hypothetical protein HPB47_019492 [Ixodes persulcatus]
MNTTLLAFFAVWVHLTCSTNDSRNVDLPAKSPASMPSELSLLKSMLGNVIPVVQRSFSQPNVSRPCTGGLLALSRGLLKMDIAAWRWRGLGIFEMTHEILFCIISNAYPSVETFFVISGFLLVYNLLPKLTEQRRKLMVLLIVEVRRYIRITTPMMFLLGLIFLFPLLVHGPAADEWLPVKIEKCYRNWWAIPLHFNNWLTHKDICAGHLWYLACDIQIFTVVALLCVLLAKNVRVGIAAMVAIAVSCNIFIAYFTHSAQIGPSRVSSGGDVTRDVARAAKAWTIAEMLDVDTENRKSNQALQVGDGHW